MWAISNYLLLYGLSLLAGLSAPKIGVAALLGAIGMAAALLFWGPIMGVDLNFLPDQYWFDFGTVVVYGAIAGIVAFAFKTLVKELRNDPGGAAGAFGAFFVVILMYSAYAALTAAWAFGAWTDARAGRFGWFIADVIFFPVGMIRGIFMYFGAPL